MRREGAGRRSSRQQLIDRLLKSGYQKIVVELGLCNEDAGLALLEVFRVLQKRLHASSEPTWVFVILDPVVLDQHFRRENSRRLTQRTREHETTTGQIERQLAGRSNLASPVICLRSKADVQ